MSPFLILLIILCGLFLFGVVLYNRLVALRETRRNAFADIEVQLRLRYDLVPNLVETVKGYATHEKELLEKVTQARSTAMRAGETNERIHAENHLGAALMQLMAVAENYPDLKASANFQQLQAELSDIENKIAASRRFFNNATNEYNTAIEQFPAILIARTMAFGKEPFFELSVEEKQAMAEPPKVSFGG